MMCRTRSRTHAAKADWHHFAKWEKGEFSGHYEQPPSLPDILATPAAGAELLREIKVDAGAAQGGGPAHQERFKSMEV